MAAAKAEGASWEKRHTQVALIALCSAINYADRVSPHPTPLSDRLHDRPLAARMAG